MRADFKAVARGGHGQVGGLLALCRDVPFAYAGALHDPVVGRIDPRRQIGIGQDGFRQVGTAAHDARAYHDG